MERSIKVDHAYADAIDLDFSNVAIKSVEVTGAGNDCLDVSGGNYSLVNARLNKCGDKGISVGEKSKFISVNCQLNSTNKTYENLKK